MSTAFWLDRSNKDYNFDIVIVGGGISGLSTAFWLEQEDPSLKIAIVEKHRLGFGATGRNAGFVTCGSVEHFNRMVGKHGLKQAEEIWRFSEMNVELLKEFIIQDKADEIFFEQKGTFSLAAQENEFKELQNVAEIMNKIKIPVEVFNQEGIQQRLGAKGFVGGIKYLNDACVHPTKMLMLLKSKLKTTTIFEETEVHRIETEGADKVTYTDNGKFTSSMIVTALNGYSNQLFPYFNDKIYPTRGQILVMDKVPRFMEGPCYANFYLDYFRQLPTGEMLIGGFRQLEKETETGYSDHITEGIQNSLHNFIKEHLPQFQNKKVIYRWSGIMGFSKDGEPMVGSLPDDSQVFFLGGYTGHGLGLAFNTGKALVDTMFGRPIPHWLSARRFG